jgi:ABC-type transporter Mla subunit MlaD
MKLAEALLLGADRNRSLEQLKQRIQVSARYRGGENPPEEARDLVAAASAVLDELEVLIHNNRTNSGTVMADGRTVTDALAERDVLRLRYPELDFIRSPACRG